MSYLDDPYGDFSDQWFYDEAKQLVFDHLYDHPSHGPIREHLEETSIELLATMDHPFVAESDDGENAFYRLTSAAEDALDQNLALVWRADNLGMSAPRPATVQRARRPVGPRGAHCRSSRRRAPGRVRGSRRNVSRTGPDDPGGDEPGSTKGDREQFIAAPTARAAA